MVKSTFLMLVANFVHSPSSLWSGEAPALLDVSSIAGVDATSVVQVGAWFVPAAIYTSTWLWYGPSPRPWVIIIDFALDGTAPAREARRRRHRRARSYSSMALHADATYTVHFGDGTNLTGVREACFAAVPTAAKAPTVLAATSMGSCADTVELKVEDMSTGNCFVYSCRKTMPLTDVWESLGSV